MGSMTSSSSTTTPKLPGYVKGLTKDIFQDAKKAYGQGPYYYEGSTVTPMSNQTTSALNGMETVAKSNSNGQGMSNPLQQIMGNGGFSNEQMSTMGGMKDLANSPALNNLINGNGLSQDQNLVADRYRTQMNSPFDVNSNPAYAGVRQQALDTQSDALSARAAAAGRYGGGMDQAILAREQGNLANRMDDAEYRNWQQRSDAAAGNLANIGQTGIGNQMGAINQKSGMLNNLFNAQSSGLNNMGTAYQTAQMPNQTMAQVGAQYEDLYSRQMQDKLRTFDAQNPFNQFQQYASLLQGAPKGQTTTQSMSPLQAGLGAGLGGLGLLGGLGWI